MCYVYSEVFKKSMFTNGLNLSLPLSQKKKQSMVWKHIDSLVKKKFLERQSVKVFLDMKEPITIDFLEEYSTVKYFRLPK